MTPWISLEEREPVEYAEVIMTNGVIVEKVSVKRSYDEKNVRGFQLHYCGTLEMKMSNKPYTHWCMWDDLSTIEIKKNKS